MHIKFLAHGTGSGVGAVRYLMAKTDHLGHVRAEVKVLRGDPDLTAKLIDSLKFVQRYTSGVVAWAKEDAPTEAEQQKFIDDFERTAFAGLQKDQYDMLVIRHVDEDGSVHLHILVPRVDLKSGKSFNIAPPGWETTFDPLRDFWNYSYGWARPDDPLRARLNQPGPMALASKSAAKNASVEDVREALFVEPDPKAILTSWLHLKIIAGQINDRDQLIKALGAVGTINRVATDSISIRLEDGVKPIRLKGDIYGSSFDAKSIREAVEKANRPTDGNRVSSTDTKSIRSTDDIQSSSTDKRKSANPEAAATARAELEKRIASRAEFNHKKYPYPKPNPKADATAIQELAASQAKAAIRKATNVGTADKKLSEEMTNDGNRNDALRATENANSATSEANHGVSAATEATGQCHSAAIKTVGRFDGLVQRIKSHMDQELERFKSDISLVDFAQAEFGYELVKRESSQASKIIKAGGDKLVVSRRDGHDVYFNVGDESDSGSIVDFVQKRINKTLGHVRKMLRQWLPGASKPAKKKPSLDASIRPVELSKDHSELVDAWQRMKPYSGSYLTEVRGLDPELIKVFDVRQDARGNAVFRHCGEDGETSGWEVKNAGFTGFSAGGQRSLSVAKVDQSPLISIVIVESGIDAISYAQIRGQSGDAYISMGGEPSGSQLSQLKQFMAKNLQVSVILAHDGDAAGDSMATKIQALDPARAMERDRPPEGKDWNDVLSVSGRFDPR